MQLTGLRVGFGMTGSHCTLERALRGAELLADAGVRLFPVFSEAVNETETRFGSPAKWHQRMAELTGEPVITTIAAAEPIGPKKLLDVMVIAPCTGNTLAKLACGVTDTPVLMAAKAHLRNCRPVVIAISTNDGLAANARNLGQLLNVKHIYWVPFGQDDPQGKANSLVAKMEILPETIISAINHQQIQPILIEYIHAM